MIIAAVVRGIGITVGVTVRSGFWFLAVSRLLESSESFVAQLDSSMQVVLKK
jgi:hypothetical protein